MQLVPSQGAGHQEGDAPDQGADPQGQRGEARDAEGAAGAPVAAAVPSRTSRRHHVMSVARRPSHVLCRRSSYSR